MEGQQMTNKPNRKKEIFNEFRNYYFLTKDIKLSILRNTVIVDEIKNLKVIELDSLENFYSYVNYDHFLIFKFNDEFYFCDTELAYSLREESMIKISDFNFYLRKDKMKKIDIKSNSN